MTHKLRACDIVDIPHLVAPLPYINFLRYFKRKHPRYGLLRLLQEAPPQWDALTQGQKKLFERQRILSRLSRSVRKKKRRHLVNRNKMRARGGRVTTVGRPIYDYRPKAKQRSRSVQRRKRK